MKQPTEPLRNTEEWHKIGDKLTFYLGICPCQRKLKSIVTILHHIEVKIANSDWEALTAEELLITALLERRGIFTHGVNCEYPFRGNPEFWEWLNEVKHNPFLQDN